MEMIFVWMLVFAGATIGLLAMFLMASERELKIKRREVAELQARSDGNEAPRESDNVVEAPNAEVFDSAGLLDRNKELLGQLSTLRNELETSRSRIEAVEAARLERDTFRLENENLRAQTQQLHEMISHLNEQLNAAEPKGEEADAQEKISAAESQLQTEIASLKQMLDASLVRLGELSAVQEELAEAHSRAAIAQEEQDALKTRVAQLEGDLDAARGKTREIEGTKSRLQEMERLHQESAENNHRLKEELSHYKQRAAEDEQNSRRLALLRHSFDELKITQGSLAEASRKFQEGLAALAKLIEAAQAAEADFNGKANFESTSKTPAGPNPASSASGAANQDQVSIQLAKEHLNGRRYHDALVTLEALTKRQPHDREARLYHLLVTIYVYGIQGYDKQIDAIKDMPNLTDSERTAARDIFLTRADEAQKWGRDEEMLRYRAWAKNVVYRVPLNSEETSQGGNGSPDGQDHHGQSQDGDAGATTAAPSEASINDVEATKSKRRKRRFGILPL